MNLKKLRKLKRITQVEVARKLKVSQQYVSKVEKRGTGSLTIDEIRRLAKVLRMDIVELFKMLIQ